VAVHVDGCAPRRIDQCGKAVQRYQHQRPAALAARELASDSTARDPHAVTRGVMGASVTLSVGQQRANLGAKQAVRTR
jgi:hypothetical protein